MTVLLAALPHDPVRASFGQVTIFSGAFDRVVYSAVRRLKRRWTIGHSAILQMCLPEYYRLAGAGPAINPKYPVSCGKRAVIRIIICRIMAGFGTV
ncbi:MAG: hypothetical protein K8S99_02665 [Planctomycetes bacterium]|nr:hypothetical protein [Planctomycetota bacterium]